jgi:hypothetical protein
MMKHNEKNFVLQVYDSIVNLAMIINVEPYKLADALDARGILKINEYGSLSKTEFEHLKRLLRDKTQD